MHRFTRDIYRTYSFKKVFIVFNNSKSCKCKVIIKQGETVQPIEVVLDLTMLIVKLDSASQNPVTQLGFKVCFFFDWLLFNLELAIPQVFLFCLGQQIGKQIINKSAKNP